MLLIKRLFHALIVNCAIVAKEEGMLKIEESERTFCQEYSFHVEPDNREYNNQKALGCNYWIPVKLPRSKVSTITKKRERWYEKEAL